MAGEWRPNPALEARIRAATRAASVAAAKVILAEAKKNTPVDTGRLVGSAHIVTDEAGEAAVVYDSTIAAAVHEDLTEHHEHGGAKFLERAMNSQRQAALEAAARPLREKIGD